MGERDRDISIGLRSWAATTLLHLAPLGIQARPRGLQVSPWRLRVQLSAGDHLQSHWLNIPSPGMTRGFWRRPDTSGTESKLRGADGGGGESLSKVEGHSGLEAKRKSASQGP